MQLRIVYIVLVLMFYGPLTAEMSHCTMEINIALYDRKDDAVHVIAVSGKSAVFHPHGQLIYYIQKDNQALRSVNMDGSSDRIVKKTYLEQLVRFSKDGQYLLCVSGGFHFMIIPGPEYATLEFLDVKNLKTFKIREFAVSYVVSWIE